MTKLSVNVNKIATLRNSRGNALPDVLQTALDIERFGAQGITVHPRPDERHIRKQDVYDISKRIHVEFNIEGYPSPDFIQLIRDVRPAQCTLVPDPPDVLTSNAGWNVQQNMGYLQEVIGQLKQSGTRVSLFIDPYDFINADVSQIAKTGTDRIELYTESYARAFPTPERDAVCAVFQKVADHAHACGLGINAGHDLNLHNLRYLIQHIPFIAEVSIGHALICDALYFGLEKTVQKYLSCLV